MADKNEFNSSEGRPKTPSVGQYYLMEKIAQGGMAEIYKGLSYDMHGLKKTVVIKKILPHIAASKEFIDSLIDEAKIAVTLSHGNIAQTYDLGKVGDDYFMVMEYVEGKSLSLIHKRCLAAGKLIPIQFLCHFMCEVLSGLDYMHRRTNEHGAPLHIIHRDISPQNLIVTYSGTVKIIDFGIAKAAFKIGTTDSGILKGKFSYMSPEQARGDSIDHRSDIFSLGVMFHEMLTGKRLFKSEDNRETLRNVRGAKVEPPSSIAQALPAEIDRIAMKALAREKRHRYPFASDMRDDLLKFISAAYPDFKQFDSGDFVRELFRGEIEKSSMEEDVKTPQMIIDHTSSALADESQFEKTGHTKAPVDMKEFYLDEEPMEGSEEMSGFPSKIVEAEPDKDAARYTKLPAFAKKRFILITLAVGVVVFLIFAMPKANKETPPPAQTSASVLITTQPPDAKVTIDGKFLSSVSPITINDLKSGEDHEIKVERDGFAAQSVHINQRQGEFKKLNIVLIKQLPAKSSLIITSTPPGATVFLDDKETSFRTPATISDMEPGKHHVLGLFLQGYRFWSRDFETHPNETLNFDMQFVRDFGSLLIDSSPAGALVMLNGVPSGATPLDMDELSPKSVYRVEIWLEGYEPYAQEVKIEAGQKQEIHVTLKKQQAETPFLPPANP